MGAALPRLSLAARFMSASAVAAELGVCRATVYRLVADGELPAIRVSGAIRIAVADVDSFIAAGGKRP